MLRTIVVTASGVVCLAPGAANLHELGRSVKKLPASTECCAVEIAPHAGSSHIFDVFTIIQ
jgi:hypothetical protein